MSMILDTGRPPVEHKNTDPKRIYTPVMYARWMYMVFGHHFKPFVFSLPAFFVMPLIYSITLTMILLCHGIISFKGHFDKILSRTDGLPHVFHGGESIKTKEYYQNPILLRALYSISPYRVTLIKCAIEKGLIEKKNGDDLIIIIKKYQDILSNNPKDNTLYQDKLLLSQLGEWDEPNQVVLHQPREGWCAFATINTMLLSIPHIPIIPFPETPQGVSMDNFNHRMEDYLISNDDKSTNATHPVINAINSYHMSEEKKYEEFLKLSLSSNNNNIRILCNFLRAPLFAPSPNGPIGKLFGILGGHWSPIGSTIYYNNDYYTLVLDANASYGVWACRTEDLFKSCWTRDESAYRGLVEIQLDEKALQ